MVLEMLNLEDAPQILDFILTIGWQLFIVANEAHLSNGRVRGEERNVVANLNLGCFVNDEGPEWCGFKTSTLSKSGR
jgi:hypothetical protein